MRRTLAAREKACVVCERMFAYVCTTARYCSHACKLRQWRNPNTPPPPAAAERFWANVDKSGDCWIWTAGRSHGYGRWTWEGRGQQSHRIAYEISVGPIPAGLTIDHLCRNPSCVNPAHLEPVTMRENTLRGMSVQAINSRKTHCKRGHEFTEANTYRTKHGRNCRSCRPLYPLRRAS